jgi:hypothetical protein
MERGRELGAGRDRHRRLETALERLAFDLHHDRAEDAKDRQAF